jgi:hypothetical protein
MFMYRKRRLPPTKKEHVSDVRTRCADENTAFNTVNRSRNFKMIEMDVNKAARLYLKTYGKLPDNENDELSAKRIFVHLISAKAAHIAVSAFNKNLCNARLPFIEEEKINDSFICIPDTACSI